MIRISQFGAILVSNTEEYHNNRTGNKFEQLDIKLPLYLGGVPDHVNTSVLYVSMFCLYSSDSLEQVVHQEFLHFFYSCDLLGFFGAFTSMAEKPVTEIL